MFSPPKRRATRQRSGYTVSGEKTGSEAKIVHTCAYNVQSQHLILSFDNRIVDLVPQFTEKIGMAAIDWRLYKSRRISENFLCNQSS